MWLFRDIFSDAAGGWSRVHDRWPMPRRHGLQLCAAPDMAEAQAAANMMIDRRQAKMIV
jgi:hypothetical protein